MLAGYRGVYFRRHGVCAYTSFTLVGKALRIVVSHALHLWDLDMHDNQSFWRPANVIATWFGVGLLPKAPGTWGSISALPLAWLIVSYGGQLSLAGAAGFLFVIGCLAAESYGGANGNADAPEIVVDEVAGQWLTLAVVPPELFLYFAGFVLFRIADIVKPWPASLVDQKMKSGFGVMLDDVVAAAYASVFLLMGLHIWSFT